MDPLYKKLSKMVNMPLVATMDAHYLYADDAKIQDILWAVNEGKTIHDSDK
jgi:DNA polymerase-3 subunit alpha